MAKKTVKKTGKKTDALIHANVILRSQTGLSLLSDHRQLASTNIKHFLAPEEAPAELSSKLKKAGFNIVTYNRFGISIAGPVELYERFFETSIEQRPANIFMGGNKSVSVNSFTMTDTPRIPVDVRGLLESVYIPRVGSFYAGEGAMPTPGYYHLRPPADITQLTDADHAHARGFRGNGIRVAMVDSGFVANHDYYNGRGYNITVMAAVGSTNQDEVGHGTGIASNLLAIAPDSDFLFVKMFDGANWAARAGFVLAVNNGARIITNSWGQGHDPLLEADIISAVNNGVTVIFACGNGGAVGWPACMDEVISVGGAFPRQDGTWEASSYASSGVNGLVPGRQCPDLSAIVGHAPQGIFIMMPTQAGATFDGSFGGGVFPNGDETGVADGWLCASGTSSAAPMVAGAATLMLEAKASLTPAEIQQVLEDTCLDVTTGSSASGEGTSVGPDDATGAGTIDIGAAIDHVAPIVACRIAPTPCLRMPLVHCYRAPQVHCLRGPSVCKVAPAQCYRAPLHCKYAPQVCLRAPMGCARAPLQQCSRAPIVDCRLAPAYRECYAGPMGKPIEPDLPRRDEYGRMVPVVILVSESDLPVLEAEYGARLLRDYEAYDLAMAAAESAYYATLEELGMEGEFDGFPDVESPMSGPFKPRASS